MPCRRALRPPALRLRPWALYLVLGVVAAAIYPALSSAVGFAVLYDVVSVSAAAAIVVGVRLHRPAHAFAWYVVAGGFVLWAVGEILWNVYELALGSTPFPSAADGFYLAGYVLVIAGIALIARALHPTGSLVTMLDALIVAVGYAVPAWVFLMETYTRADDMTTVQQAISMAYPAMDVGIVAVASRLVITPGRRTPSSVLLAAAAVLLGVVDFLYFGSVGAYWAPGSWVFAGYVLFYVIWGTAALHPSVRTLARPGPAEQRLTPAAAALLFTSSLAAFAVLAWRATAGGVVLVDVLLATALVVLVLVRMTVLMRTLARLRAEEHAARAEAELARAEAETAQRLLAEQNDRLRELDRAKDSFLGLVSHDLRTPLTSIMGYVDLLRDGEGGELSPDQDRFLHVVDRNSRRLLHLVDDLLLVARYQAGRLDLDTGEVDLAEVVAECVEAHLPRAGEKGLELVAASRPVRIEGDRKRLAQLLDNLLTNAVKFTPAGGRVEVRVGPVGNAALVEVADSGIGIAEADRRRLFERFFRASAAECLGVEGAGLGLTIAKAVVDAHGGAIGVESREGEGTTFRVELPTRLQAALRPAAAAEL